MSNILSVSELTLLKALWKQQPLSAREIHERSVAELDKVTTLAAFAHDFGKRVMEVDAPLPVNMFTGSKLVDQRELAELEQLLNDWPSDEEQA